MTSVTTKTKDRSSAKTMSPFEKECIETIKKVNEYKLIAEANAVSSIYKNPDLVRDTSLKLEDITNNAWRVYFSIANDIINVEQKNTLDEITINMYLSKHSKLSKKYDEYGGYGKIESSFTYIEEANFDSYVNEVKKWNAVMKLARMGFPVKEKLSKYVDAKAEDIYNELEALLNHTFINVESEVKTYNACDGLFDLIDKLNAGSQVGMPLKHCDILNREIGGINFNGNIYGLGANSGVGKSTTAINYLMPSVLEHNEKMVIMINEEDQDKVKKELSYEELQKMCEALGVDRLNSWSRVNCVHNGLYEYFLKYVLHKKEDRDDSIYKVTGGISHDIIERFYTEELAYEKMAEEFDEGWMMAFDIADLKFVRGDGARNNSIATKYYYDLKNFFETHEKITDHIDIEKFVTVKVGDEYYQGYIDALVTDENGNYTILDWKTSSIYKGDKAKNECGQLVMYSLALHQMGIPFEKIKIAWNFLKYQCVTVQSKKGVKKVREIERFELGEKLQANAKMWLKEFGYEENMLEYLDKLAQTNDITCLPPEVQEKYELNLF